MTELLHSLSRAPAVPQRQVLWPNSSAPVARLHEIPLEALPGAAAESFHEAFRAFHAQAQAHAENRAPGRPGVATDAALARIFALALQQPAALNESDARDFFTTHFKAWRIEPFSGGGFLTGYYEPEVEAALEASAAFCAPVLRRPDDLVTFLPGETPAHLDASLAAARRLADGTLAPYATRAEIEDTPLKAAPLLWLRDYVEVFLMQVQGSARARLPDGRSLRLGYAGRNGHPYVSIGRWLINAGKIAETEMTLAGLKQWLRANGETGREVMRLNPSYVFFRIEEGLDPNCGPIAAASVQLTPLRSIAVDRTLWPYGLPFWIDATLPWTSATPQPFQRLMIAQDTGSAITGPARADIFFGTGDAAGARAGDIRHAADVVVLLPRETDR